MEPVKETAPCAVQSTARGGRLVVVVNGQPRAGKDTACALMQAHFTIAGWTFREFSTIDPVRDLLAKAGVITQVDLDNKTDGLRDLLAEVGDALQKFNAFRTNALYNQFKGLDRAAGNRAAVLVVHLREPLLIEKARADFEATGVPFKVVMVKNDRARPVTSNAADAGVDGTVWDYAIENQRDIAFLATQVSQLVPSLITAATLGVKA